MQTKSVFEIAVELNRLQELGMLGKLPPADIVGGTFSLSNIGAVSVQLALVHYSRLLEFLEPELNV